MLRSLALGKKAEARVPPLSPPWQRAKVASLGSVTHSKVTPMERSFHFWQARFRWVAA